MVITWDEAEELATEQNSVNMWPIAPIWMRDELRSKVRSRSTG